MPYVAGFEAAGEIVREQFKAPELNFARYIKNGTVTDADNGE
ncbi:MULTISPECIES: hypothetical protein [unclassified Streptomyces]|nr:MULTISPECIES: hypothetical protein [unclassified Streptomyces]